MAYASPDWKRYVNYKKGNTGVTFTFFEGQKPTYGFSSKVQVIMRNVNKLQKKQCQ